MFKIYNAKELDDTDMYYNDYNYIAVQDDIIIRIERGDYRNGGEVWPGGAGYSLRGAISCLEMFPNLHSKALEFYEKTKDHYEKHPYIPSPPPPPSKEKIAMDLKMSEESKKRLLGDAVNMLNRFNRGV